MLGERNKCWVCYNPKDEKKKICLLYRCKKNTLTEGCTVFLCRDCRKNMMANT